MKTLLSAILILAASASAIPMIYTFTGAVPGEGQGVIDDRNKSGLYWSNGISYGQQFQYSLEIDLDRAGEINYPEGSVGMAAQGAPGNSTYFAAYSSGDLFADLFHGSYYIPGDSAASYTPPFTEILQNYGVDYEGQNGSKATVNPNHWGDIAISSADKSAKDWAIGDGFYLSQTVQNPLFVEFRASLRGDVVLTGVAPAVPEPGSIFLMSMGLAFLGLFGIKGIKSRRA
jgi:PEP-CTERM motif